ncbi:MAG: hypothetical protein ABSF35_24025 [Polyangia bacterium]|jgi:hypothetical protein
MSKYWSLAFSLRRFLNEPLTTQRCLEIFRQNMQSRERNLLALVKQAIYANEGSPYLKLLRLTGCEYGDFEKMVRSDGIEPSLVKLCKEGVYVSIEEIKGKKQLVRGSQAFEVRESDFDNPLISGQIEANSGASRSTGTRVSYDLDFITETWAVHFRLSHEAYGVADDPVALWYPIMPGAGPMALLAYHKAGKTPLKWFSPVEKKGFRPSLRNRMGTSYLVYMGRLLGAKWPGPDYVPLADAWRVAQWISEGIRAKRVCRFVTYVSAAVRICQAAKERGLDLAGTKFVVSGEPVTEVKRKEIQSLGAEVYPVYALMEAGIVGGACCAPVTADEVHFFKDSLALIQHPREVPHACVSVDAFLLTTLCRSTPKILLNVETGDYGVVEKRDCGCKFGQLGLTDHIRSIRGFDKMTGEGMTFIGTDLVRILEEVLPTRFGGASTDYQVVEEEDERGHTRMSVVVSPAVGDVDERALVQIVLAELSKGRDARRMMAHMWSQAKTLRVKRATPFTTARGKLLPLHIQKT